MNGAGTYRADKKNKAEAERLEGYVFLESVTLDRHCSYFGVTAPRIVRRAWFSGGELEPSSEERMSVASIKSSAGIAIGLFCIRYRYRWCRRFWLFRRGCLPHRGSGLLAEAFRHAQWLRIYGALFPSNLPRTLAKRWIRRKILSLTAPSR